MAVSGVVQSFQRQVHPLAEWLVVAAQSPRHTPQRRPTPASSRTDKSASQKIIQAWLSQLREALKSW